MYENQIKTLEIKFDSVGKQLDKLKVEGNQNASEFNKLNNQRITILEELRILRRKKWEYDHERVNLDDD